LFHQLKGFLEMAYACARVRKWDTHLLKLRWPDSSAQAKFKAALGEQIERGGFSGEEHGMAILITKHITANAKRCGCFGSYR